MAGVGHELPLLGPGPLHRPDRPPGQEDADAPEHQQRQCPDGDTVQLKISQGGLFRGDIREDQRHSGRTLQAAKAQAVFGQLPDLRLRGHGFGDDIGEHLLVAQIEAVAALHGLAPGGDPDDEAGQLKLARRPALGTGPVGAVGRMAEKFDALFLQIDGGGMDHQTKDHAHEDGDDGHGDADEFEPKGSDHVFSTSRW